jgi:hypothetical protein
MDCTVYNIVSAPCEVVDLTCKWKTEWDLIGFYIYFFYFFSMYCIQHCFVCRPPDFTVSEDAGIEPRTIATSALAIRRSNQYRLDLIH